MAIATLGNRTSRIDLRMTDEQKEELESAADVNGTSLTQWAMSRLLQCARAELAEQRKIVLSAKAFDEFVELLDQPEPEEMKRFKARKTRWE